jgi:hypothetical protein
MGFLVQFKQAAGIELQFDQILVFICRTGAPVNGFRMREGCNLVDPGLKCLQVRHGLFFEARLYINGALLRVYGQAG